jgi:tRNA(Ile)-lysidine synthase
MWAFLSHAGTPISCRLFYQAESPRQEVVKTCGDCPSGVSNEWDRSVNSEKGRFIRNVSLTITRYDMLAPGDKVVVGVSGGPDSVSLLHALYVLRDEFGVSLHVAHLNHMLRGEAADEEAEYVEGLADKLGIRCTVEAVDVREYAEKARVSIELAARDVRYDFYRRTAVDEGASKVALGHHAGDQAETVLLRLIRGTGLSGLGGIPAVRPLDSTGDITVIRPLIDLTPLEIRSYCHEAQLVYYIDASNESPVYLRNRIRHELIPLLEQDYNPRVVRTLSTTAELAEDDDDYISRKVRKKLGQIAEVTLPHKVVISIPGLGRQHIAIQRRIVRQAVCSLAGELDDFQFIHVEKVLELAGTGKTGSRISLPGGLQARRDYEQIIIEWAEGVQSQASLPKENRLFEYRLQVPGRTDIPEACITIEADIFDIEHKPGLLNAISSTDDDEAYFDLGLIGENITVRNRRPGDRLSPLGMKGRKKLKDVFIDKKISRNIRDNIPVITWGTEILWVVGLCVSDFAKLSPATEKVLHLRATCRYPSCDQ